MKVLRSFLNDYVNIDKIDYHELANKMVLVGNEFESINKISESTNLVVGYVIEAKKHPESNKLNICKVDINDGETHQILCGASNVKTGDKVIVAKVGATLPGGVEIKKAMLAGYESQGMICSLLELGIESKYLSQEEIEGIHVLPIDVPIGEDAIKYLNYNDEVIDFELTANRGDLQSILGMAYEVGSIYNLPANEPDISVNEVGEDINKDCTLNVETDNCSIYLAKKVTDVEIKESPEFIKHRLMTSGIRPINNVVDISNYVMLEYGQPLHFFDADLIGNDIVVRMANKDEQLVTLDSKKRTLKENDIVIANKIEAVGLAGVMGGFDTEITSNTKNILIESAIFNPYKIRQTSASILKSEASRRYEKGIDPNRVILALNRACHLLEKYASGKTIKGVLTHDKANKTPKLIEITLEKVNLILGMTLTIQDCQNCFDKLKFSYKLKDNTFEVEVPTRRIDISIKEDLIEEIGRIYGYDKIEGILPKADIKSGKRSSNGLFIRNIRNQLLSLGLNQTITYSLTNESKVNQFNILINPIVLQNPMSEERKYLRMSLIPSLLEVWEYNYVRSIKDINIFETAAIYYDNDGIKEDNHVAGLIYGNYVNNSLLGNVKCDFYVLKGIVESLLNYLGLNSRYSFKIESLPKELHPNKSASIVVDNEIVGFLGAIHPTITNRDVYVFEMDINKLMSKKVRLIKAKEISKYPSVNKDVAFVVNKDMNVGDIISIIKRVGGRYLTNYDIFDIYKGDNVKEDEKSVAFSLTFQNPTKTMEEEEINKLFNGIINEVETKLEAKLRR